MSSLNISSVFLPDLFSSYHRVKDSGFLGVGTDLPEGADDVIVHVCIANVLLDVLPNEQAARAVYVFVVFVIIFVRLTKQ